MFRSLSVILQSIGSRIHCDVIAPQLFLSFSLYFCFDPGELSITNVVFSKQYHVSWYLEYNHCAETEVRYSKLENFFSGCVDVGLV